MQKSDIYQKIQMGLDRIVQLNTPLILEASEVVGLDQKDFLARKITKAEDKATYGMRWAKEAAVRFLGLLTGPPYVEFLTEVYWWVRDNNWCDDEHWADMEPELMVMVLTSITREIIPPTVPMMNDYAILKLPDAWMTTKMPGDVGMSKMFIDTLIYKAREKNHTQNPEIPQMIAFVQEQSKKEEEKRARELLRKPALPPVSET